MQGHAEMHRAITFELWVTDMARQSEGICAAPHRSLTPSCQRAFEASPVVSHEYAMPRSSTLSGSVSRVDHKWPLTREAPCTRSFHASIPYLTVRLLGRLSCVGQNHCDAAEEGKKRVGASLGLHRPLAHRNWEPSQVSVAEACASPDEQHND